jgi:hypothetical protein
MDASSLTAAEVAGTLHLAEWTVRRYRTERKLYSYRVNGRLVFATWQFSRAGDRVLPGRHVSWPLCRMTCTRKLSPGSS